MPHQRPAPWVPSSLVVVLFVYNGLYMRGSFCWYCMKCWPSQFKFSFHSYLNIWWAYLLHLKAYRYIEFLKMMSYDEYSTCAVLRTRTGLPVPRQINFLRTSKLFSFYLELHENKFKNLIQTSKFKFSFRGLLAT